MFRNYFKTAFRSLWKNKAYSFLNIMGLAIGIACAALIFLWVESELTFDHYFANRDHLYKIKDRQTYSGVTYTFDATPGLLAEAMKREIPGIESTSRSTWGDPLLIANGDKDLFANGCYVDSSFLKMFGWQFVEGNPANAFSQLYSLVVTEKFADKLFGRHRNDDYSDVIGKAVKVDNKQDYIIRGVIKDPPENVSVKFDWLAPFEIFRKNNLWLNEWGNNGVITYVELLPHADTGSINKKLYNFIAEKTGDKDAAKMSVYPMNRWRLYDNFRNGKETEGRIKFVRLFSLIAWIILIIACINFMNLATARSEQRAREVGVRKVLGAVKTGLVGQFLVESLILSALATLLSIAIVYSFLSAFNALVEKQLSFSPFNPLHLFALISIMVLCGLIAGSYPAFYLSSFRPVMVLKSMKLKLGAGAGFIRKGLVVLQFTVSIVFVISTIVIYLQIRHVKDRDLGYNRQHLITMATRGNLAKNFIGLKEDLLKTGVIEGAALSSQNILQVGSNSGGFSWQGKNPNQQLLINMNFVNADFIPAMGVKLSKGRNFYENSLSDTSSIIINETLARQMQVKDPLGSLISWNNRSLMVVGIVHDFIYNNIYEAPSPLVFLYAPSTEYFNFFSIRMKPSADAENLTASLDKIEKVMKRDNPGYPFEYKFVDAQFDQLFKTESLIGKLAGVFAFLTILISCLGLFGLAAYTAERRTREMGIRKVLGATAGKLVLLLSKDFLVLIFLSCVLAFPVAWWIMHGWLQNYNYRIKIQWWIFLSTGILAVLIAVITVSWQAVKAAIVNPVDSLRSE